MTPQMGVSCTADSNAGKMGPVGEHVTHHMMVGIDPMAEFQPPAHVCRSKMLNELGMVRTQSLCVCRSPDSHVRNTEACGSSSCTSAWTSRCTLRVMSSPPFSTAVCSRKGALVSQVLVTKSEHTSIVGLVVEDAGADIQQQPWRYHRKPRKVYIGMYTGKRRCHSYV
jgi:hypothetical protein